MEFIRHLPIEVLGGLIIVMITLIGWLFRVIYKLIKDSLKTWEENRKKEFTEVKEGFVTVNEHFTKLDRNIDMLFIEQKSSDFALNILISNGKNYSQLKETEKQRLIRDYEFQNLC